MRRAERRSGGRRAGARAALPIAVALVVLVGGLATSPAAPGPASAAWRSPVFAGDVPDPTVVRDGATYYAYATGDAGPPFQVLRAPDPEGPWEHLGSPLPELPGWAEPGGSWAPAVTRTSAGWVFYASLREAGTGRQCLTRAVAPAPVGPFVDRSSRPWACPAEGQAYDPSVFTSSTGTRWLLYRVETPRWSGLASHRLTADGLTLEGDPIPLLGAGAPWEQGHVENPEMLEAGGRLILFYSGADWRTARYGTGYAVCAAPSGPCERRTVDGPLLTGVGGGVGTGGASVVADGWGTSWLVFHAWDPAAVGYPAGGQRRLHVAPLLVAQGEPLVAPEARALGMRPQGGGWVLTESGHVAPFGGAPDLGGPVGGPARDLAVAPDGDGYVVVDAWGGLHRYGSAAGMPVNGARWWPGWDVARAVALAPAGTGGWVLDAFGGVHPFGLVPGLAGSPYWPGWDIARDLAIAPDGLGGWVLDGWGGLHAIGSARRLSPPAWWPGWDIARGVGSAGALVDPSLGGRAGRSAAEGEAGATTTLPTTTLPTTTTVPTTTTTVDTTTTAPPPPPPPPDPTPVLAVLDGFGGVHVTAGGVASTGTAWSPVDAHVAVGWTPHGWWVLRHDGRVRPA